MSWDTHFPSDPELDEIKQLLGARTIHEQLGVNIDTSWRYASPGEAIAQDTVLQSIIRRMHTIYGEYAVRLAANNASDDTAYRSMYDTALMRTWWEKFGDTVELRGSADVGEAGGRLGSDNGTDANTPAQPHEEGDGG